MIFFVGIQGMSTLKEANDGEKGQKMARNSGSWMVRALLKAKSFFSSSRCEREKKGKNNKLLTMFLNEGYFSIFVGIWWKK